MSVADLDRNTLKLVAGGAAAFVLAVALGAGGALAVVGLVSDDDEPNAVAATLQRDQESGDSDDALERALEFLVDEAVEAGRLTEEEGAVLKERLERGLGPLGLPRFDRGLFERGPNFFRGLRQLPFVRPALDLGVASGYLGLSEAELRDELAEGKTLAEIAREQGKSVDGLERELVDAAEARIDGAVEDGRLTEEQAAALKEGLEERIGERVEEERGRFGLRLGDLWRDLERFRGPGG